jgi:hypothetical protein
MATFTGQITVPNTYTWSAGGTYYYFQQTSNSSGGVSSTTDLDAYLADLATVCNFTYTLTVGATTTVIDISFVDFVDTGGGNPTAIGITNDAGDVYFTAFTESSGNTDRTTICQTCVPITKLACEASYNFKAGLTPNTEYTIALENQKGKVYSALITTDSIGGFTIDATATEFPEGMFIPESGIYQLRAYTDSEMTILAPMIFGTTQYDCIELSFLYNQTFTSDIIGVYLLITDELTTTVIVDDNGSAISLG